MNFEKQLFHLTEGFTPVVEGYDKHDFLPIDLSVNNKELEKMDFSSVEAVEKFVEHQLQLKSKKIAYGGYQEKRNLYRHNTHFSNTTDERNIHLGMDVWAPASTKVLAPLDGEVHSFQDNLAKGDYGPTIILAHSIGMLRFYTLYGHLSRSSLSNLTVGQIINQGELFAELGDAKVNGGYAPHLHFQLIKNIENYCGDYPGVCSSSDLIKYTENCPDPNLLLKLN